jgi:uncharacterized metal-binding protein
LGAFIDPDEDQIGITLSEGRALRGTKNINPFIGFIGAFHVAYWLIYAYMIGLVGGHRSVFSHGWIIGTVLRIIYFNIPFAVGLWLFYNWAVVNWGWHDPIWSLYLDWWLAPYLLSQFLAWFVSDGMHLILDTEWAKYRLYTPVTTRRKQ